MRHEIIFAYFRFYFRISIIKKILKDRSWGDAIFNTGKSKIDFLKKIPRLLLLFTDISIKFGLMFLSVFRKNGICFKELKRVFLNFFK